MADQETPTGIKQLIQSMAPEAPSVKEGIVTSASPLEVTLKNDAKMVLTANSLVVPRSLTDYQVEVDLETGAGSLISKTKTDGNNPRSNSNWNLGFRSALPNSQMLTAQGLSPSTW